MSNWIAFGLRRGVLTTRYPFEPDAMPPAYRGSVLAHRASFDVQHTAREQCLSNAITTGADRANVDPQRCFQCGQCARIAEGAFSMEPRFESAMVTGNAGEVREMLRKRSAAFGRSIHIRHVDAGSDGSEEQELQAIFNPFYDANRLGIFLTATPRHADILVVSGVVTKPMKEPLRRAFEAMPEPKIVIALGTSACSGGIFSESNAVVGPVSNVIPVDVFVPGTPPSPLAILHGLWVALGRTAATGVSS